MVGIGEGKTLETSETIPLPYLSSDDFVEPGGGLALLAATFGNSWKLPDSEVSLPSWALSSVLCSLSITGLFQILEEKGEAYSSLL